MPAIRRYEVEQSRSVRVSATSPTEAMLIAEREFAKEQPHDEIVPLNELKGQVTGPIEIQHLEVRKEIF
jgi:hypothetical protein